MTSDLMSAINTNSNNLTKCVSPPLSIESDSLPNPLSPPLTKTLMLDDSPLRMSYIDEIRS